MHFKKSKTIFEIIVVAITIPGLLMCLLKDRKTNDAHNKKLLSEKWCAAIEFFDSSTNKNIIVYNYITEKNFVTTSVQIKNSLLTNNDFLVINDAAPPWDEDITLRNGLHIKIQLLSSGKLMSNTKMDSLKKVVDNFEPHDDIQDK